MQYVTRRSHRMEKTSLAYRVPARYLWNPYRSHPSMKNSASMFSRLGHKIINYLTCRSYRMQKHMFGVTCPGALFVETALGPPEHEKQCINFLCPGRTSMHYVTRRSLQMQKHMFGIMGPRAHLWNPYQSHPSLNNSASTFRSPDAPELTT
jgi:hypothetical protein